MTTLRPEVHDKPMSPPLQSFVTPRSRETFHSIFARVASARGVTAREYARDMGIDWRRLVALESDALAMCERWLGISRADFEQALSWTTQHHVKGRRRLRGEVFTRQSVNSNIVRGCPACLEADCELVDGGSGLTSKLAIRGEWNVRAIGVCVDHGLQLIPLWDEADVTHRHDYQGNLAEVVTAVRGRALPKYAAELSGYDRWIHQRLVNKSDSTWFSDKPLHASVTFCLLLGAAMASSDELSAHDTIPTDPRFLALGFNAASEGLTSLYQIFKSTGGSLNPRSSVLGFLRYRLAHYHADDADFAPFSRIVSDAIESIWPLKVGERILGNTISEIKVFNAAALSAKYGVTLAFARNYIKECQLANSNLQNNALSIRAEEVDEEFLRVAHQLVNVTYMMKAIGVDKEVFRKLNDAKFIQPRIPAKIMRKIWHPADADSFLSTFDVAELGTGDRAVGWMKISSASARAGLDFSVVVEAIINGRIQAKAEKYSVGFSEFHVSLAALKRLKSEIDGTPARSAMLTLSEFSREVGLRDAGQISKMIVDGHVVPGQIIKRNDGQIRAMFSIEHQVLFRERFLTIGSAASEFKLHRNTVRKILMSSGVATFMEGTGRYGLVWLRQEVLHLFKSILRDGSR